MPALDPKLLREFADRAYNYRWKTGKDQFRALYIMIEILEYAEKHQIDVSTPQAFQNLLTKLRDEQRKRDNEASAKFLKEHAKPSLRGKRYRGLKHKDWSDFISAEGELIYGL